MYTPRRPRAQPRCHRNTKAVRNRYYRNVLWHTVDPFVDNWLRRQAEQAEEAEEAEQV